MPRRLAIGTVRNGWTLRSETWKDGRECYAQWECPLCHKVAVRTMESVRKVKSCRSCYLQHSAEKPGTRQKKVRVAWLDKPIADQICELRKQGRTDEDIGREYKMTVTEVQAMARSVKA